MNRIVLITGGTKGIGLAVAKAFLQRGDTVVGASRNPQDTGFPTFPLDLTNDASIRECVSRVLQEYGRIDVLVNCAGVGIGGPLEDFTFTQIETECTLNLLGTAKMIATILPHMREQKYGRIITIGSVAGRVGLPFQSMYSASKAGLGSMSDALRLELKGTGVQTCLIEPADTTTGFTAARTFTVNGQSECSYREACERALNSMIYDEIHGKSPDTVARAVLRAADRKNMPARIIVGLDYKFLFTLVRLLPRWLAEVVMEQMYLKTKKDVGFRYK